MSQVLAHQLQPLPPQCLRGGEVRRVGDGLMIHSDPVGISDLPSLAQDPNSPQIGRPSMRRALTLSGLDGHGVSKAGGRYPQRAETGSFLTSSCPPPGLS
jgi:hypothetical protein